MRLMRLCLLIALPILSACASSTQRSVTEPYPSSCSAQCFESCPALPAWQGRADGTGDWDALAELTIDIGGDLYQRCDARREACAACLRRLERVGVIKIGPAAAPDATQRTGGGF